MLPKQRRSLRCDVTMHTPFTIGCTMALSNLGERSCPDRSGTLFFLLVVNLILLRLRSATFLRLVVGVVQQQRSGVPPSERCTAAAPRVSRLRPELVAIAYLLWF